MNEEKLVIRHVFMGTILITYCLALHIVKPYSKDLERMQKLDLATNFILFVTMY